MNCEHKEYKCVSTDNNEFRICAECGMTDREIGLTQRIKELTDKDEPTVANVSDIRPKFQMISKREYFDLQVQMANNLTRDEELSCRETADCAQAIIDQILSNNDIKVEGQDV